METFLYLSTSKIEWDRSEMCAFFSCVPSPLRTILSRPPFSLLLPGVTSVMTPAMPNKVLRPEGLSSFPVLNLNLRARVNPIKVLLLFTPVSLTERRGGSQRNGENWAHYLCLRGAVTKAQRTTNGTGDVSESPTMLWGKYVYRAGLKGGSWVA